MVWWPGNGRVGWRAAAGRMCHPVAKQCRPPAVPVCLLQGATFACVNAAVPAEEGAAGKKEEGDGAAREAAAAASATAAAPKLATFALRIKLPEVLDQFIAAVNAHKEGGKKVGEAADP